MKKTLQAVEEREEEILETVERPFHWIQKHWLIVTILVLAAVGGTVGWQYHVYSNAVYIDASWQRFAEVLEDEDLRQAPEELVKRLEMLSEEDLPAELKRVIELEIGLRQADRKKVDEAKESLSAVASGDDLVAKVASSRLPVLEANEAWRAQYLASSSEVPSGGENPRVEFVTSKGTVVIELYEDYAPNHAASTISLVESGYYDGTAVHAVLADTRVHWGLRFNAGAETITPSGPGYRLAAEIHPDLHHDRGEVGIMRDFDSYDSAGAELFVNLKDNRALFDGKYTVIGKVVEGLELVENLIAQEDFILKASVVSKRDHDYEFEKLPEPR